MKPTREQIGYFLNNWDLLRDHFVEVLFKYCSDFPEVIDEKLLEEEGEYADISVIKEKKEVEFLWEGQGESHAVRFIKIPFLFFTDYEKAKVEKKPKPRSLDIKNRKPDVSTPSVDEEKLERFEF